MADVKYVSTISDDYDTQLAALARRQKYAELLAKQGSEPIDVETVNGIPTPISPFQGLAKVMQSGMGAYLGRKAEADAGALKQKELGEAKDYYAGFRNKPAPYTLPGVGGGAPMDLNIVDPVTGNPVMTTAPRSMQEQRDYADEALFSGNPTIRKMAAALSARATPKLENIGARGAIETNPDSPNYGKIIGAPAEQVIKPEVAGGMQWDPVTKQWSEIPNYTRQQAAIAAARREGAGVNKKPPSAAFLRLETDDLKDVQLAGGIASDLDSFAKKIDEGKLTLGLGANLGSKAGLAVGMANQNAKEYGSFRASLEKQRNDSLRLNKGTQTEGDAVRAWNELFQNINDQGFVRQRIDEIKQINRRAQAQRIMLINDRRELSGYDPIDENKYLNQPSAYENSKPNNTNNAGGHPPDIQAILDAQKKTKPVKPVKR
jgi:hypothetical protein